MELRPKTHIVVEKGNKTFEFVTDNDAPLGLVFDALMEIKGYAVERMVASQKQEEREAEEKMGEQKQEEQNQQECCEEGSCEQSKD